MTFMDKITHVTKITNFTKQSFGELTPKRLEMKTIINILLGCSMAIILTFCQPAKVQDLTLTEKKKITQEIETLMAKFFSPEGLTYETHVSLRANHLGYVYASDGKILFTDFESYRSSTEAIFKNIQRFTEVKRLRTFIYVLSKDAATCTVEFESKFLKISGDTVVNNGCWTFVFKKFAEGWETIQENGTHAKQN
jgi:hypothetical protein